MVKEIKNNRELFPKPPSLLIVAHCSTIRRKTTGIDANELSAILNDCVYEAYSNKFPLKSYLNSLNEIVKTLNSHFPSALLETSSHYFFTLVRNTIRLLLCELYTSYELNNEEIYILRNCTVLIHQVVKKIDDVSKILHWITDESFLDALANCLIHINKISKATENQHIMKQITRLLNILCNIQQRLPINLHQQSFVQLLQPIINCLTSSNYIKLFSNLKANAISLTESQKLFLIKCPYFLTTYNGPEIERAIEHVLEIMLPRYVSILDKHMKTIKEWQEPIMHAIHNLIMTIVYAEGYFSSCINNKSFQLLINHLLNLLNETSLINKIHPKENNIETLLIDATLVVFSIQLYEPNALDYIKQLKPIAVFRQLTTTSREAIVLNAYMMLVHVMDENDIETVVDNLSNLLSTTLYLLGKAIETRHHTNIHEKVNQETVDRNIIQLLETLRGLVQYEQIKNDILKQKIVSHLMYYYENLHGLSKQLLLECFWTLSFNEKIAQQLREHSQFILSLHNILQVVRDDRQQNTIRHSNSYCTRQNGTIIALIDRPNDGIRKVADGLLWKLVNESEFRENIIEKMKMRKETRIATNNQNYKYDIMISYCDADKDIAQKIQRFLTNEDMKVIADAIENSQFVIICISDLYKRDNNCQAEVEYAFNSKRFLLPLIVRAGYKPSGWLASMANNSTYIDFAGTDFKTASTMLVEAIKQLQCQKETPIVRPTASTRINIVHNPSSSSNVSDKPYAPVQSSIVTGSTSSVPSYFPSVINGKQQMSSPAISRNSIASVDCSTRSDFIDKQQKRSEHATSQSSMDSSISTIGSAGVVETQQAQIHTVLRPSTSGITPSTTSTIDIQQRSTHVHPVSTSITSGSMISTTSAIRGQQQPKTSIVSYSKFPTSDANTSTTSSVVNKQYEQHQMSMGPVSKTPTSGSIVSTASVVTDKHHQQQHRQLQQRMPVSSILQSAMVRCISSDRSATVEKSQQHGHIYPISRPRITTSTIPTGIDQQEKRTTKPSRSRSSTPGNSYSTASAVVDKQQLSEKRYSVPLALISTPNSSTVTINLDHKQQQTTTHSVLIPPKPLTVSSNASLNVEKMQQQTQIHSKPRTSTVNAISSAVCSTVIQQQQQAKKAITGSLTNGTTLSIIPIIIDKEQQQPIEIPPVSLSTTSYSTSFDETINVNKRSQQQTQGYLISQPQTTTYTVLPTTSTVVPQPQQLTSTHLVPRSPKNNTVSSASTTTIDKLQQKTQLCPISQSQTYNSVHSSKSVFLDQYPQLTPMHLVSQSLTNNTISSAPITTIVKPQQETQVHPVSQLRKSGSFSSAASALLDQESQLIPMQVLSPPLAHSIVSSALPVAVDKKQQLPARIPLAAQSQVPTSTTPDEHSNANKQLRKPIIVYSISPPPATTRATLPTTSNIVAQPQQLTQTHLVPQSPINNTAFSVSTTTIDKLQQKTQFCPISQSQTCGSVYSGTSVLLDQHPHLTSMHRVPQSLAKNTISTAPITTIAKSQQKTQLPPASQLKKSDSFSSATSAFLNQQPQRTSMHPVSQPLTNNILSSALPIAIDRLQQKAQLRPVAQSQRSGAVPCATPVLLDQHPQLIPMHLVSQPLTNNTISSAPISTIAKSQQKIQVHPGSQLKKSGSFSSAASALIDQESQLTQMPFVSQSLTSNTVSSAPITTIGKQRQKTEVHPVSQSQTYGSIYSGTSAPLDQYPQLIPMHLVSQPLTNNTISSAPITTIAKSQQKTQVHPVSQLRKSGSFSSAASALLDQESHLTQMPLVSQSLTNNTISFAPITTIAKSQQKTQVHPVSQLKKSGSFSSAASALLDQKPQLTQMPLVSHCTTASLYAMMPLCESMSGKTFIRLFRMCQEKPSRLYNQLNEELRIRFKGLTFPMAVYAEFLIKMDGLVGLVPAHLSEIHISRPENEGRATFRPRTVQEEPISMQRSSKSLIDMTVSRSLSNSALPIERTSGTTTSNNTRFLERSFVQPPLAPGRPYMLIVESIEESTVFVQ
ncbi:unnamed protein product [Rotaria sordida]|uniref:TIR domain-containing protein n=1 Tax=Rotaria sordida TaxID=392033 RepID=A0A818PXB6_9BILA|nr:unnamed protein product [Rotaria sordida]